MTCFSITTGLNIVYCVLFCCSIIETQPGAPGVQRVRGRGAPARAHPPADHRRGNICSGGHR